MQKPSFGCCRRSFRPSWPRCPCTRTPPPRAEAKPAEPVRGGAAWGKAQRLMGGEWLADAHYPRKTFLRFLPGSANTSMWVETRDKDELDAPLPAVSAWYLDPVAGEVRSVTVGGNGSFAQGRMHWEGETLVNEIRYQMNDGTLIDGAVQVRSYNLVERRSFEADQAFRWQLFQKSDEGVTQLSETTFHRERELTELTPVRKEESKPMEALKPLVPLIGALGDGQGMDWTGAWRSSGRALWVERTLPNPLREGPLHVTGFYFHNGFENRLEFLGFSDHGDLILGNCTLKPGGIIETAMRVTPPEGEVEDLLDPKTWGRIGETLTPMGEEGVQAGWVVVAPGKEPKVIGTLFKGR
ncbi:MAG: hypothetical protein R3F17_14945 [Planctomycetota bacterium]